MFFRLFNKCRIYMDIMTGEKLSFIGQFVKGDGVDRYFSPLQIRLY